MIDQAMTKFMIVAALLSVGCLDQPEEAPVPVIECCAVECRWTAEGQCPESAAFSYENTREDMGDGTACFVFTAACVTVEVSPDCVPDSCKQNQFTTCQPGHL